MANCNSAAPFFLRLALGITFLWAGLGKVMEDMPVKGADAAALANMGVITPATPATPAAPTKPADPVKPADKPAEKPKEAPPATPPSGAPATTPGTSPESAPKLLPAAYQPAARYTAGDFPDEVKVKRVYMLASMLSKAAHPGNKEDGSPKMALWPAFLGEGSWPVYQAWAVAVTEIAGGLLVLVGLLTRLSAFGLAVVMLGAMWLAEIGPAMQSGNTMLLILPRHGAFDPAWMSLLWQFCLLMSAFAVMSLGSGCASFDGALFPGKPPSPKPKPAA